jgi:threonine aldolase
MRQAGILAAAGIVALDSMVDRLAEDHERARSLAAGLRKIQGMHVETDPPASNMVYFHWEQDLPMTSDDLEARSASQGVLIHGVGLRRVRLVVHYWVSDEDIERSLVAFEKVFRSAGAKSPKH